MAIRKSALSILFRSTLRWLRKGIPKVTWATNPISFVDNWKGIKYKEHSEYYKNRMRFCSAFAVPLSSFLWRNQPLTSPPTIHWDSIRRGWELLENFGTFHHTTPRIGYSIRGIYHFKVRKNYLLSFALKEFCLYLNTTDTTKDFYH